MSGHHGKPQALTSPGFWVLGLCPEHQESHPCQTLVSLFRCDGTCRGVSCPIQLGGGKGGTCHRHTNSKPQGVGGGSGSSPVRPAPCGRTKIRFNFWEMGLWSSAARCLAPGVDSSVFKSVASAGRGGTKARGRKGGGGTGSTALLLSAAVLPTAPLQQRLEW